MGHLHTLYASPWRAEMGMVQGWIAAESRVPTLSEIQKHFDWHPAKVICVVTRMVSSGYLAKVTR